MHILGENRGGFSREIGAKNWGRWRLVEIAAQTKLKVGR